MPLLLAILLAVPCLSAQMPDAAVREQLIAAVMDEGEEQPEKIEALAETGSDLVATVLAQWRGGNLFVDTAADGTKYFDEYGKETTNCYTTGPFDCRVTGSDTATITDQR